VGFFVIYTGLHVLHDTSRDLIDTMLAVDLIDRIKAVAMQVSGAALEALYPVLCVSRTHSD
jgi:divalent metal cation (Fe/Co/Zn/Cd) transporter